MKKVIVTGSNGQLGQAIRQIASHYSPIDFVFTTPIDLDITNKENVDTFFNLNQCDYVINCAAYTAVDKAESEPEIAQRINEDAVQFIAQKTKEIGCKLIHISTDYVFDGLQAIPRTEEDPTNPINVYGMTKFQGELKALAHNPNTLIIRTSWVYSRYGNNFVKTMMRLFNEKETLSIIDDQIGSPTNAIDLAAAIADIVLSDHFQPGIMNYSNEGQCSWFDFAQEIKRLTNAPVQLNPIPTTAYPTPAKRPAYSLLNKSKIKQAYGLKIPDWKTSLAAEIKAMKS